MNAHQPSLFDTEQWRAVPGYEESYEVSDRGRVKNLITGRIIGVKIPRSNNHIQVGLMKSGQRWDVGVHRLVMLAFVGECPDGMEVDHVNTIKYDNRLENLEYVTHQENIQRAVTLGLFGKGSKDTASHVLRLYELGWLSIRIAEYLGITKQRVQQILAAQGISVIATKPRKPARAKKPTHVSPRKAYRKRVLKMYRDGMTTTAIGQELGISPQAVSTVLSYWLPKEERRSRKRTREEAAQNRQRIHELNAQGYTRKQISEMTKTNYNLIGSILLEAHHV